MRVAARQALLIRLLGYGGAAVLISVAIGVLVVTFTTDRRSLPPGASVGSTATPSAPSAAGAPLPSTAATGLPGAPLPSGGGTSGGTTPGSGYGGPGPDKNYAVDGGGTKRPACASRTAAYTRSGDTVTVRARLTGSGYISAFVEREGSGTVTKSASGAGEHVFAFTGVPASITRAVGLTTIGKGGLATCEVKPKK